LIAEAAINLLVLFRAQRLLLGFQLVDKSPRAFEHRIVRPTIAKFSRYRKAGRLKLGRNFSFALWKTLAS
jgi:hypothetical protein